MLQHACRDGHAHIGVMVSAPLSSKRPYRFRLRFDEFGNLDDGLPASINLSVGRRLRPEVLIRLTRLPLPLSSFAYSKSYLFHGVRPGDGMHPS